MLKTKETWFSVPLHEMEDPQHVTESQNILLLLLFILFKSVNTEFHLNSALSKFELYILQCHSSVSL